MEIEWAYKLIYCISVCLGALLPIFVINIIRAGFGYITSQCDPKFVEHKKIEIYRSGIGMMVTMVLFVINRLAAIMVAGSGDAYDLWRAEHASEIAPMALPIFLGVWGLYATILLVRFVHEKREWAKARNAVVISEIEQKTEETMQENEFRELDEVENFKPEAELERVLLVINKRY